MRGAGLFACLGFVMATSKTTKVLIIGGAVALILFLVAVIGIALIATSINKPSVAKNSVLLLNVSGSLPDYTPDDAVARAIGFAQPQSFTGLLTQLRKAKVDDRISAVFLDISFPGIGWGRADELRDAVADFRASGKPVYAYMEIGSNKEYYIATAADKIFLPPSGDIYINGFAAEAMFYKGSLDKLGVEAEVIQIGPKYKNAPDQYTKKEMGEGQREVINAVLDEYFGRFINGIVEARKKSVEDVKKLVDDAPYNARQAKELGLIDDAFYREQVYEALRTRLGYGEGEKLRTLRASEYKEISSDSLGLNKGEKVAIVFASGAINVGKSSDGPFGGEMVGSDTIVAAVNDAADDSSVKAIVLRIDSPGGSALASDLMWYAIENAKAKKPVVVSMGDVAASGGYYIACNANKIVAQPSTITGSIGVFMGKPVVKGFYDWLGITNQYVMRGKNAGLFRETEKWTPEERAKMEAQTNSIYFDNFVPKVSAGRNMSVEQANTLGQGRVWTGTQAKGNGLVDEFGGLEKAIQIAKELAGLPADKDVRRVVFPEPRPFFETLFENDDSAELTADQKAQRALADSLPEDARRALKFAALFDQMKRGESMLLMPFELRIK
jgi:protease-4